MELQEKFAKAMELHMQGLLHDAKEMYVAILEILPENTNVLGNLGVVCRDLNQLDEAYNYCYQATTGAPQDPALHINLGAVCEAMRDYDEAKKCYERALHILPYHPKALNNLGKIHHIQGDVEAALVNLEKALAVEPNYPLALNNIGVIISESGDIQKAVTYLEKSYSLAPHNIETLYNLAGLYNCLEQYDKAVKLLKAIMQLKPDHALAQHMLAALVGKTTETAPAEYVAETFDRYAHRFDTHLQGTLGYDVPQVLASMLLQIAPGKLFNACLDLGCGTGLSGEAFMHRSGLLVGVDISSGMLAKAEEKRIYTKLVCQEIYDFLHGNTDKFDLVIAVDVLIYLGRLDVFFAAVAGCTPHGAIIACSIEKHGGAEDYILRSSGRYAHRPSYLSASAENHGFHVICHKERGIRKENDKWIPGDLYILKRTIA